MPDTRIRVMLIEDNPGDGRLIQEFLGSGHGVVFDLVRVDRLSTGLTRLHEGGTDIVLLDLTLPDSHGLDTFRRVRAVANDVPIVILSGLDDDALAMQAVREGAQDYLVKGTIKAKSLMRVVRYGYERHRAREGHEQVRSVPGRLVGVVGAKGGTGATTVALNVAAAVLRQGQSVTVMELGPGWGGLSCQLNQRPPATLASILGRPAAEIDAAALAPLLYRDPAGMQVLFGAQHAGEFQEIEPAKAEAVVGAFKQQADFTIVDLPRYPCAAAAAVVRQCHQVVMVVGRDPASRAAGKAMLDLLTGWAGRAGIVSAVLVNRMPLTSPVDTTEMGAQLDCDVVVVVPNALEACQRAQKLGLPLVSAEPGLPASARLMQVAEWLMARRAVPIQAP